MCTAFHRKSSEEILEQQISDLKRQLSDRDGMVDQLCEDLRRLREENKAANEIVSIIISQMFTKSILFFLMNNKLKINSILLLTGLLDA